MTRAEAEERARRIWPAVEKVEPWNNDSWWITVKGEASVHRLDQNGHVVCSHSSCELAEQRLK